ncbi:MAG: hypothetical protein RIQ55_988 [Pseudomonadota bacterium]|jgi:hypothetical protein
MSYKDKLTNAVGGLVGIAFFLGILTLLAVLIKGMAWFSLMVMPWLPIIFSWTTLICLVLILPSAIFKKTRQFSAIGFVVASYVYGALLCVGSFIITYEFWGATGVAVGLFLFGIGIVFTSFLAAMFNAEWAIVWNILVMVSITYGLRLFGYWLLAKVEQQSSYIDME